MKSLWKTLQGFFSRPAETLPAPRRPPARTREERLRRDALAARRYRERKRIAEGRPARRFISDGELDRMRRLISEGKSLREVEEETGWTGNAIRRRLPQEVAEKVLRDQEDSTRRHRRTLEQGLPLWLRGDPLSAIAEALGEDREHATYVFRKLRDPDLRERRSRALRERQQRQAQEKEGRIRKKREARWAQRFHRDRKALDRIYETRHLSDQGFSIRQISEMQGRAAPSISRDLTAPRFLVNSKGQRWETIFARYGIRQHQNDRLRFVGSR